MLVNTRKKRTIAKKTLKLTHCALGDPTLLCWLRKKLNQAIGSLSKVRHFISQHLLKTIYYTLFSSHLIYGCQVWRQNHGSEFKKIETLQEKAIRILKPHSSFFTEKKVKPIFISENIMNSMLKKNKKCSYQGLLLTSSLEQDHFRSDNLPKCNMVAH